MRKVKIALCLVLVLGLVMSLAACGGVDVSGKYNLVSMESEGETVTMEDLQAVLGTEIEMYLELKPDGTGVMNMMGETVDMEYADGMIWAVGEEDGKVAFTVEDGKLTMTQDGETLIFQK